MIEPPASCSAEHLEQFIRPQLAVHFGDAVFIVRDQDGAHREVDACGQSGCGDDDFELACFRQRLDQSGALGVAHAAVVKGDTLFEAVAQLRASDGFLLGGEDDGIRFP